MIKTPKQIARERENHERSLRALDDAEQTWAELTRAQQLTERVHEEICKESHYDSGCRFRLGDWTEPNTRKGAYLNWVNSMLLNLPESLTDDQIVNVIVLARKQFQ